MFNKEIDDILQSYQNTGIINPVEGIHYTPKEKVAFLLSQIKELLFPGFFGTQALCDTKLKEITKNRVISLSKELEEAFVKCLQWNPNSELRLNEADAKKESVNIVQRFLKEIPAIRSSLKTDAKAMYDGDPAANSIMEVILSYPGFQAVMAYRVAHFLQSEKLPLIPRMITEIAHQTTGVDIHPGAKIGDYFCIDHGTGIVIGETAIIGEHVKLYQGVTLGAFSTKKTEANKKRHPTLNDRVTVYAMSTILGGDTVIGEGSIVGGNVWLTHSLKPKSKIYLNQESKAYTLVEGDD